MPRVFSDEDRDAIRKALVETGRRLFVRSGIRKTNVDELARAAGIAKGTFYRFFQSKEDLFFAILDEEEGRMRDEIEKVLNATADAEESLRALFSYARTEVGSRPLFRLFRDPDELALLSRGVPSGRLARHLENDVLLGERIAKAIREKGGKSLASGIVAGVLRAVIMLTFHEREIGTDVYEGTLDAITEWIAAGMAGRRN